MSRISFIRHGFRGASNLAGETKIEFSKGSNPKFLTIPVVLTRIYAENLMNVGTKDRIDRIVQVDQIKTIIPDMATQRTFETSKFISSASNINFIECVPTFTGENVDPLVSLIKIKVVERDRIKSAELLREIAHKIAKSFLNNLGLDLKRDKSNDSKTKSAWELLGLPELGLLSDVVVMCSGHPQPLNQILQEAEWENPKDLKNLVNQAQLLVAIEHQINIPPGTVGDQVSSGPCRFILDKIKDSEQNIMAVTHDSVILPLLTSLGLVNDVFIIIPLQEIRFDYQDERHIKVTSIRFCIDEETGSVSMENQEEIILGIIRMSVFRKLAELAGPMPGCKTQLSLWDPKRVTVSFD